MGTYIVIGYILDQLLGDPSRLPHPVRAIGRLVDLLEKIIRGMNLKALGLRTAGIFLALITIVSTYLLTWGLMRLAWSLAPWLFAAVCSVLIYYTLAVRSLSNEAMKVYKALEEGDDCLAREKLGAIVGRDTAALDSEEIVRATVESVAENTVDGVLAPLFYVFLGGPALGMAYKAVNTLDSMVGYRNERYCDLGWASARLDDLANWLPARFAGLIMPLAGGVWGKDTAAGFRIYQRDKRQHPSPNAGHPEAAMAGLLGIRLGGTSCYQGQLVDKPHIGDADNPLKPNHILEAVRIMKTTAFLSLVVYYLIAMKFGFR